MRKLKNMRATTCRPTENGGFEMVYHQTVVFASRCDYSDIIITLRTGGYRTVTTKARINWCFESAGIPAKLWQRNWDWFISVPEKTIEWDSDEMVLRFYKVNGKKGKFWRMYEITA